MKCPYCGFKDSRVIDSRPGVDPNGKDTIKRRRECERCKLRFNTYEQVEKTAFAVIKKDNSRQYFDKEKIINGLMRSCEKRPVSLEEIKEIADSIELEIISKRLKEISSREIGEMVMKRLMYKDDVAYVRFASVYKEFVDIESFKDELDKLIKLKNEIL